MSTVTDRLFPGARALGPLVVATSLVFGLAACGGGSDNPTAVSGLEPGVPMPPGAGYTLSGSISVAGQQTVDTDTNDPNQPGRRSNNSFDTVQPLANPGRATGYLALPGGGADGPVKSAGDLVDGYSVRLLAGQVVELDFSADPATFDIDLHLYDSQRRHVGASTGRNSYECIQIRTDGDYVVASEVFVGNSSVGSSLYQLRVLAPGQSSCSNAQVAPTAYRLGQIIGQPNPAAPAAFLPAAAAQQKGLPVLKGGRTSASPVVLVGVPQGSQALATAFAAHAPAGQGKGQAGAVAVAKSELAAAGDRQWRDSLSDQARRMREAIDLSKAMVDSGDYLATGLNAIVESQADRMEAFPPNDRLYSSQRWHYEMINLPTAANILATFTPAVLMPPVVAVLDTGIIADHPDLAGQLLPGMDFVTDADLIDDGDGIDTDPNDLDRENPPGFHGTHVAGTIAAATYNNIGVAGVAPVARIMPLKVLSSIYDPNKGYGTVYDLQQALLFAGGFTNDSGRVPARKADVVNMSLGFNAPSCDPTLQGVLNQVRAGGTLLVAASGNSNKDNNILVPPSMPANCNGVLAVGAVGANRVRPYYSQAGSTLDVAAPGGNLLEGARSTEGANMVFSTSGRYSGGTRQPDYLGMIGTSMASPHVAGVLALMRWVNPQLSADVIERSITDGTIVDDLGATGRDDLYGYGLINADKAVRVALASLGSNQQPGPAPGQVVAQPSQLNLGTIGTAAEFTLAMSGSTAVRVTSVTVDGPAIAVAAKAGAVDTNTGLGVYVVTPNRAVLAAGTTAFPNVVVSLAGGGELKVPVTISREDAAASTGVGSIGPVYVLIMNADDARQAVVAQASVFEASGGSYAYRVTVPGTARIKILAGTDLDNDGYICNGGEGCGAYPFLGTGMQVLEPRTNLTGVDFSIAPIGGYGAQSLDLPARLH